METKMCRKCNKFKSNDQFSPYRDGLTQKFCKECTSVITILEPGVAYGSGKHRTISELYAEQLDFYQTHKASTTTRKKKKAKL